MDERVLCTMAVYDSLADDYAEKNAQTPPDLVTFREAFAIRVGRGGRVVVGNGLPPQRSPSERREWFVNRHPDSLVAALAEHSHRDWLQVLAAAS